jgi:hypothetical protein
MVFTERFHSYFTSWSKVKSYAFCKQAEKIPNNQMNQNEKDVDNSSILSSSSEWDGYHEMPNLSLLVQECGIWVN